MGSYAGGSPGEQKVAGRIRVRESNFPRIRLRRGLLLVPQDPEAPEASQRLGSKLSATVVERGNLNWQLQKSAWR